MLLKWSNSNTRVCALQDATASLLKSVKPCRGLNGDTK